MERENDRGNRITEKMKPPAVWLNTLTPNTFPPGNARAWHISTCPPANAVPDTPGGIFI
jgi:hypothetical protein